MSFDFSKISRGISIGSIRDPSTLFDALPAKADGYGYLRAVQKTVLDQWAVRRGERDLVIKTNTGGGKTIVGLLILQCCLHDGFGPALYLTPDPHLQDRVLDEAAALGLQAVREPNDPKFTRGEAICVTTMNVLINGKSRFGITGSGRLPIPVKSVVVDDAHAALALAEAKTQLSLPRGSAPYHDLLALFEPELRAEGETLYRDIEEGDFASNAVLRVPIGAWYDKQSQVVQVLRPHRATPDLEWTWPLVHDLLPLCQAVFTPSSVEIAPPCTPIEKVPSFADAARRIYLTATLADDSVLVTHFDAAPESISTSIVPDTAADLGDRLILAPEELNGSITHFDVRTAARDLAVKYNVVVLAPSHRQANLWREETREIVSKADETSAVVDRLRNGHVGLVVVVARYDGIDLPDDACRVLIIDGLPQAYSGIERREAAALRDSDAMITRQLQRLEQGMGRGVRSRDDRCAVILMSPRLTALVNRPDVADRLSPATRAQLELSRRTAKMLEGSDMNALQGVIDQVIGGDPSFRELSREALVDVTYGAARLSETAPLLRAAYNAAARGQQEIARRKASDAVNAAMTAGDERLAGWLGETLATYLYPLDRAQCQAALATAKTRNAGVLRPLAGMPYRRLNQTATQSKLAGEYLRETYSDATALRLGIETVLDDLVWDNDRTDDTENALADLARHLGFEAQQPEREYGRGSDVLWALGSNRFAVIEAKSGSDSNVIWKKDVNQLAGSVNWCAQEYPDGSITPMMMHPSRTAHREGTPPPGARVLTPEKLTALIVSVKAYATALARDEAYKDDEKIAEQLQTLALTGGEIVGRNTVAMRRES